MRVKYVFTIRNISQIDISLTKKKKNNHTCYTLISITSRTLFLHIKPRNFGGFFFFNSKNTLKDFEIRIFIRFPNNPDLCRVTNRVSHPVNVTGNDVNDSGYCEETTSLHSVLVLPYYNYYLYRTE